jgi:hypothetical protein
MSYFAVIVGDIGALVPGAGTLVPVRDAQSYIAALGETLSEADGRPQFLWEDGESGTTTDVVREAEERIQDGARPEDTIVGRLIRQCTPGGNGLRIWWAGNEPNSHQRVENVSTEIDAMTLLKSQALAGENIALHLLSHRGESA